ncbi:hypothetical protein KIN20_035219 [Parelaphostrongylus tenuis]|uniref:Uncharacterized protein n=1 Tax=Parelaphostrongylus tenuis TaxID=148309 RepID=A0AAD5WKL9_PARTN|nr:hypothetical protein KIN20_035219 [Parelaphostrongylus tenuis]
MDVNCPQPLSSNDDEDLHQESDWLGTVDTNHCDSEAKAPEEMRLIIKKIQRICILRTCSKNTI